MNEITNYIFGTLNRQDTALRGMTRDLRLLKNAHRNGLLMIGIGAYSMTMMVVEMHNLKSQVNVLKKEVHDLKTYHEIGEEEVN